jgi:hypothetical protein
MKRSTYTKILVACLASMLMLSSCLKDNRYVDFSKDTPLVELPLAAYNANAAIATPYSVTASAQTLSVVVNLASNNTLNHDLAVTLAVDNTGITAAPAASTSAGYAPLPTADYTVSSLTATIPAGQRQGMVNFVINPALVGTTVKNYALRVVIKDGGGIQISNYNTLVYVVTAK